MYVILLRNKNAGQQGVDFVKYEIGDFVSKPVIGICKIENILYLNPQDEKNDKLYYLMKPVEDEKDKIYVPVSSSDSRLRLCLTNDLSAEAEKTCTREKMYCYRCKVFPDSRKSVIYGTGSCT